MGQAQIWIFTVLYFSNIQGSLVTSQDFSSIREILSSLKSHNLFQKWETFGRDKDKTSISHLDFITTNLTFGRLKGGNMQKASMNALWSHHLWELWGKTLVVDMINDNLNFLLMIYAAAKTTFLMQ